MWIELEKSTRLYKVFFKCYTVDSISFQFEDIDINSWGPEILLRNCIENM